VVSRVQALVVIAKLASLRFLTGQLNEQQPPSLQAEMPSTARHSEAPPLFSPAAFHHTRGSFAVGGVSLGTKFIVVSVPSYMLPPGPGCYLSATSASRAISDLNSKISQLESYRQSVNFANSGLNGVHLSDYRINQALSEALHRRSEAEWDERRLKQEGTFGQLIGAVGDFWRNYNDMKDANTIGADKYFHAKANNLAAARGSVGERTAAFLSNLRENWFPGQNPGGIDSQSDRRANDWGRSGGDPNRYRPNGLDPKY